VSSLEARLIAENETLREQVRQMRAVLVPDMAIPDAFRLTPSERRVFAHLAAREVVTYESIMLALYSDRANDFPQENTSRVFICKIRTKLEPHGVFIRSVWGRGYRLEGWPPKKRGA